MKKTNTMKKKLMSLLLAASLSVGMVPANTLTIAVGDETMADPETPTNPVDPETPADPADPETPTDPADPETPADPADPETPTNPADPETPADPADPETPADPADPETPADPADPETPTDPVDPAPVTAGAVTRTTSADVTDGDCSGTHDGWQAIDFHYGTGVSWTPDIWNTRSIYALENGGNYYLTEDISDGNWRSTVCIPAGVTSKLCLNGHTVKLDETNTVSEAFSNGSALIKVKSGGTLILCDCSEEQTGCIEVNGSHKPSSVVAVGDVTIYEQQHYNFQDATFRMYSGNIVVRTPLQAGADGRYAAVAVGRGTKDWNETSNNDIKSVFEMIGGKISVQDNSGNDAVMAGINGHVTLLGDTVSVSGDDAYAVRSELINSSGCKAGSVTINSGVSITGNVLSNVNTTITGTQYDPVTIGGDMVFGSGAATLTNVNVQSMRSGASGMSGTATLDHVTMTSSEPSAIQNGYQNTGKIKAVDSTLGSLSAEGISSVELTNSTLADISDGEITLTNSQAANISGSKVTVENSTVSGTTEFTDSLSLKGAVTLGTVSLKEGQTIDVQDALNGSSIGIAHQSYGTIVNAHSHGSLEGRFHAAAGTTGDFTYGDDGSVSFLPQQTHTAGSYTAYTNATTLTDGGKYYLSSTTGIRLPITIPEGISVTFCMEGKDLENSAGSVFVNNGTLTLENCASKASVVRYSGTDKDTAALVNTGTLSVGYNVCLQSGDGIALKNSGTVASFDGSISQYCHLGVYNTGGSLTMKNHLYLYRDTNADKKDHMAYRISGGTVSIGGVEVSNSDSSAVLIEGGNVTINDTVELSGSSAPTIHVKGGELTMNAERVEGPVGTDAIRVEEGAKAELTFSTWDFYDQGIWNAGTLTIQTNHNYDFTDITNSGTLTIEKKKDDRMLQLLGDVTNTGGTLNLKGVKLKGTVTGGDVMLDAVAVSAKEGSANVISTNGTVTLNGTSMLTERGIYLENGGKIVLGAQADKRMSVAVAMEQAGVFAENVTDADYAKCFYSKGNSSVVYDEAAKTLSLSQLGAHTHEEVEYTPLDAGVTKITQGNYYLTQDTILSQGTVSIEGKVSICLNGHTLNLKDDCMLVPKGAELTICDCSEQQSGSIFVDEGVYTPAISVNEGAVLNMAGGSYGNEEKKRMQIIGKGTVNITGGTYTASKLYGTPLITAKNVSVSGGTFLETKGSAMNNPGTDGIITMSTAGGSLDITGGTFKSEQTGKMSLITAENTAVTISGDAKFERSVGTALRIENGSTLKITGGTFDLAGATTMVIASGASAEITGGSFTCKSWMELENGATATVGSGVTVNASDGLCAVKGGSLTVNGGTFTQSYVVSGAKDASAAVTINGGTFTASSVAVDYSGSLTVNGGTFNGTEGKEAKNLYFVRGSYANAVELTLNTALDTPLLRMQAEPLKNVILGDDFSMPEGKTFALYFGGASAKTVIAVVDANSQETLKGIFTLPENHVWKYESSTKELSLADLASTTHTHTDNATYVNELTGTQLSGSATSALNIKKGAYLTENVVLTDTNPKLKYGVLCLNGHTLDLGTTGMLTLQGDGNAAVGVRSCPNQPACTLTGSIFVPLDGSSLPKTLELTNLELTSANEYTLWGESYNYGPTKQVLSMDGVTVKNTGAAGTAVRLFVCSTIKDSTIIGPAGGSAAVFNYTEDVTDSIVSTLALTGKVWITGGKGLDMSAAELDTYKSNCRMYRIDADGLTADSRIEVTLPDNMNKLSASESFVLAKNVASAEAAKCFVCLSEGYEFVYSETDKTVTAKPITVTFDSSGGAKGGGKDSGDSYPRINIYDTKNKRYETYTVPYRTLAKEADGKRVFQDPIGNGYEMKWNTDYNFDFYGKAVDRFPHTFTGWYTQPKGGEKVEFPLDAQKLTASATVYAHWTPDAPVPPSKIGVWVYNSGEKRYNWLDNSVVTCGDAVMLTFYVANTDQNQEVKRQWHKVIDGKAYPLEGETGSDVKLSADQIAEPGNYTFRMECWYVSNSAGMESEHTYKDLVLTVEPQSLTPEDFSFYIGNDMIKNNSISQTYTGAPVPVVFSKFKAGTNPIVTGLEDYFICHYTGKANDGTSYPANGGDDTAAPTKAGSYTITLEQTEAGKQRYPVSAVITMSYTIEKAKVAVLPGSLSDPLELYYRGGEALDLYADRSSKGAERPAGVVSIEYYTDRTNKQPAGHSSVGDTGWAFVTIDTNNAEWSTKEVGKTVDEVHYEVVKANDRKPDTPVIESIDGDMLTLQKVMVPGTDQEAEYWWSNSYTTTEGQTKWTTRAKHESGRVFTVEDGVSYYFDIRYPATGTQEEAVSASLGYKHVSDPSKKTYTITYVTDAYRIVGSIDPQTVSHGTKTALSDGTGISKKAYTLIGWGTYQQATTIAYELEQEITVTKDLTLYPVFVKTEPDETIKISGPAAAYSGESVTLTINADTDKCDITWYRVTGTGGTETLTQFKDQNSMTTEVLSYGTYTYGARVNDCEIARYTFTVGGRAAIATITPNGGTYGGTIVPAGVSFVASNDKTTTLYLTDYTLTYTGMANDGTQWNATEVPAKAGTYTVTVTIPEGGDYVLAADGAQAPFVIEKADPAASAVPKAKSGLTYNGKSQALAEAGVTTQGTFAYSLSQTGSYTANVPTVKDADDYTVWYKILGDANYNDTTPQSLLVSIAKKKLTVKAKASTITYGDAPSAEAEYDGFAEGDTADVLNGTLSWDTDYTQFGSVGNNYTIKPAGCSSKNYEITYEQGTLTVVPKTVTLNWGSAELTYNGSAQQPSVTAEGLVNNDSCTVTVSVTGQSVNAGSYTASATGLDNANYRLPQNVTFDYEIVPKPVKTSVTVNGGPFTYSGQKIEPSVTVTDGEETIDADQYTVSYKDNIQVGTATVTIQGKEGGNYQLTGTQTFAIGKGTYTNAVTEKKIVRTKQAQDAVQVDLGSSLSGIEGAVLRAAAVSSDADGVIKGTPAYNGTVVTFDVNSVAKETTATIQVTVESTNYENFTAEITVETVNKKDVSGSIVFADGTLVYTGSAVSYEKAKLAGVSGGVWTYTYAVSGSGASLDADGKPLTAGSYSVTAMYEDADHLGIAVAALTVTQAAPDGEPAYTAVSADGKTLADAALAVGTIRVPGTIRWVDAGGQTLADDTKVVQGTAYKWLFTPTDSSNYTERSGSITLWKKPAGGSGGSGSSGGAGGASAGEKPASEDSKKESEEKTKEPSISGKASGWSEITRSIRSAKDGDMLTVELNGAAEVPGRALKAMQGRNITVEFALENGFKLRLNGVDLRMIRITNATDYPIRTLWMQITVWKLFSGVKLWNALF